MEEDDQPARASIQHAVVVGPHVAAHLSQLAVDLGAVREREVRYRVGEFVESVDLASEAARRLASRPSMNSRTGSPPSARAVVDRLEVARHGSFVYRTWRR